MPSTPVAYRYGALHHTLWTKRDGAPSDVYAITQTPDGWLWLGSTGGLYRFDGDRFERRGDVDGRPLLSVSISALQAVGDTLWIGYSAGGLTAFSPGGALHYGAADSLPPGTVIALANSRKTEWVATTSGLAFLDSGRWHIPNASAGLPSGVPWGLQRLTDGALLAAYADGLYRLPEGSTEFQRIYRPPTPQTSYTYADDGAGAIWVYASTGELHRIAEGGQNPPARESMVDTGPGTAIADRNRNLWMRGRGRFVLLASFGSQPDPRPVFTGAQGMSGVSIYAAFVDREGNRWFGTSGGVDRVRPNRLNRLYLPPGTHAPGVFSGAGAIWLGAADGVDTERIAIDGARVPVGFKGLTAAVADGTHGLWLGSRDQIAFVPIVGGKPMSWPLPRASVGDGVLAMTMDSDGLLWVSISGQGLFGFRKGVWISAGGKTGLPLAPPFTLYTDERRIWLGYGDGRLAVLEEKKARVYGPEQGLNVGAVLSLTVSDGRLWVGGENGLAVLDSGRFVRVPGPVEEPFRGVSGMVLDADGVFWIHDVAGIRRFLPTGSILSGALFNHEDGMDGVATQSRPRPTLATGPDGRIWYASSSSVGWIDPKHTVHNSTPPNVQLIGIATEDRVWPPRDGLRLPKGTSRLRIDFTATALAIPERVTFLYRLHGVDSGWRNPGQHRSAYYTNLESGDYVFDVRAANEDGVWNENGASLSFSIKAAFYQTTWFRLMCALLAAALIGLLYRWRVRLITRQLHERLQVRTLERERIARVLHDTLLQGVHVLTLRCQTAVNNLPPNAQVRLMVEAALDGAEQIVEEGREQLNALRGCGVSPLGAMLHESAIALGLTSESGFAMTIVGAERPVDSTVANEIRQIVREALANALRHAGAKRLSVTVVFGNAKLRVTVLDDGCGMLKQGESGQWGLTGMSERATAIGAALSVFGAPGNGTSVELTVPSTRAYAQDSCN